MAEDYFLKLDGIEGESKDSVLKGQIELSSWSWGMSHSGTSHGGEGNSSGKVSVGDLSFTKPVDKSTPELIKKCASGKHIANGTLTIRKSGGDSKVDYIVIELKQILVSSWQTGGASGGSQIVDSFSLNFAEFKFKYTIQTAEGGKGAEVPAGWNMAENKAA
jgi:type VI secretion system secreted protein Hcp